MRYLFGAILFLFVSNTSMAIHSFSVPWMNSSQNAGTVNYNSADHAKGIFVIETWFYSCPYCQANEHNVIDLAADYSNEPRVQVLDLGADQNDRDYKRWISTFQPNHPVLKDVNRKVLGELGTEYYPSTYVLDCHLNIVYSHVGLWEGNTGDEVREKIDALLAAPCGNYEQANLLP